MEWTSEKKEKLMTALIVIQNVCSEYAPHCERCPLRTPEDNCTLHCNRPDQWKIDTPLVEWHAFR